MELDEEDKAAIKSVSKGYRYFSRKLDDEETALIGDIKPKKLGEDGTGAASAPGTPAASPAVAAGAGAGAGAGAPGAAASTGASTTPQLPVSVAPSQSLSEASAWNSAGTFEERDLSLWLKQRLQELIVTKPALTADLPFGRMEVTGITGWDGTASIFIRRGSPRCVGCARCCFPCGARLLMTCVRRRLPFGVRRAAVCLTASSGSP